MAGLPGYIQADPSRSAGLLANALMQESKGGLFGGVGTSINSMLEKERIDAERADAKRRADELFAMQKTEHQMKVDDVKQKLLEKEQANKYASVLNAATSGNVVGLGDQAKLSAIVQDTSLTPEQQAAKIQSVLPAMTKAYENSPEEQLKVLRSINPPGGLAGINPATRIALLKEAEAPLEKMQALNAATAAKVEEAKVKAAERLQQQQMLYAIQAAMKNAEIAGRQAEGQANRENQKYLKELEYNKPEYIATVDGSEQILTSNEVVNLKNKGVVIEGLTKIGGVAGSKSGGTGSSNDSSKAYPDAVDIGGVKVLPKDATIFGAKIFGAGDTIDTITTVKTLQALNYPNKVIQQALDAQEATNSDAYLNKDNIDKFLEPQRTKDGVLVPPSVALKIAELKDQRLFVKKDGKLNITEGVTPNAKQLAEIGVLLKTDTQGNKVLTDAQTNVPTTVLPKTNGLDMGPTLDNKVLGEYDKVVKEYVGVPNATMAKAKLGEVRSALGPTAFENRYPGVAAKYKLY